MLLISEPLPTFGAMAGFFSSQVHTAFEPWIWQPETYKRLQATPGTPELKTAMRSMLDLSAPSGSLVMASTSMSPIMEFGKFRSQPRLNRSGFQPTAQLAGRALLLAP